MVAETCSDKICTRSSTHYWDTMFICITNYCLNFFYTFRENYGIRQTF